VDQNVRYPCQKNHGIQEGQCWKRIDQIIVTVKVTRVLRPTYSLTMSWGMDGLVDALAAAEVVDMTYLLSCRKAKNAGHGSVGVETYINRNGRISV